VHVALDAVQAAVAQVLGAVVPQVVAKDLPPAVLQQPLEHHVIEADGACNIAVSYRNRAKPLHKNMRPVSLTLTNILVNDRAIGSFWGMAIGSGQR
jgi:hypothetical protein